MGVKLFLLILFLALGQCSRLYDVSTVADHCLKAKAINSGYSPKGSEYKIGNITVYESDNRSAMRLLIAVHDISGMSDNARQFVDEIAEFYNFRVVLPDFFGQIPWLQDSPPEDPQVLQSFLDKYQEDEVKDQIYLVMNAFQARENITDVGIFGFCWGGGVSAMAATEIPEIKAAGLVHPSNLLNYDPEEVKAPMYLLPSMGEPDLIPYHNILVNNLGRNRTGHRRYDNSSHGFAGARGNFTDPVNKKLVDEVIDILGGFFQRMIPEP